MSDDHGWYLVEPREGEVTPSYADDATTVAVARSWQDGEEGPDDS